MQEDHYTDYRITGLQQEKCYRCHNKYVVSLSPLTVVARLVFDSVTFVVLLEELLGRSSTPKKRRL